jgi:hypothetical protein
MQGLGLSIAKQAYVDAVYPVDQNWWVGDGVNDYINGTDSTPFIWTDVATQDLSISFWIRIDSTSKKNQQIFCLSASESNTNNNWTIFYTANSNRIYFRQRFGGSNHERYYALHDDSNDTITGITSPTNGWIASQRGNVNDDGFVNITFTYDASSGSNGIKAYWNATELNVSGGYNIAEASRTNFNPEFLGIGENVGNASPSAGVLGGAINEIKLYSSVLSSSDVTSIYNSGRPLNASDVGVTSNLITEWELDTDVTDSSGIYTTTNNGGTFS